MSQPTNETPQFFYIYLDNEDMMNLLSDEDRGRLFSLLFRYAKTGQAQPIENNPALAIAFDVLRRQIDRDFAAYSKKVARNRENGKKGGAPKGNANAAKQPKTTQAKFF